MHHPLRSLLVALLTLEARAVLRRYQPRIIAVTGNVGKTSAKDAIYTVLSAKGHVRKSEKSFNSEVGVPLTILGRPNAWSDPLGWLRNLARGALLAVAREEYPKTMVLEVGADRPGDISRIAQWLRPHVVVLTRLPEVPVHLEQFQNADALIAEKLYLVKSLRNDGTLILNSDDLTVLGAAALFRGPVMTYGRGEDAAIRATRIAMVRTHNLIEGIEIEIKAGGERSTLRLRGVVGVQHVYPALAACAVGLAHGISLRESVQALERHSPAPGRMRILAGLSDTTLIDDSYNASPAAVEEALRTLHEAPAKRRVAILGDMLELGARSAEEHRRIGNLVPAYADMLVAVGVRARDYLEAAKGAGMKEETLHYFATSSEAAEAAPTLLKEGDAVLIKGSQSIRMERVTKALLKDQTQADTLLVRQDAEWQKR